MIWGRRMAPISAAFLLALKGLLLRGDILLGLLQLRDLGRVPLLVVGHLHADHACVHVRVITTAELGTLTLVDNSLLTRLDCVRRDPDPGFIDIARHAVHLAAELWDPP